MTLHFENEQEFRENVSEDVLERAGIRVIPTATMIRKTSIRRHSHADFQAQIVELAAACGWQVQYWWKSFHSPSGFPDLFLCRPPEIVTAELKIPPDRESQAQAKWSGLLRRCPQVRHFVWTPADWDEIVKVLR